jgi:chemotaxis protein MotB
MADEQPIIIIKKKGGHGGHHGGAWKVAYADFVTAMMALFIVLWLMSSTSKQTKEEIAGYFNDPKGTAAKHGSDGKPVPDKPGEEKEKQMAAMVGLKAQLLKAIQDINLLNKLKKQIEITVTEEGLRIELVEDSKGTFFEVGSAQPTAALEEILKVLATQLKTLPNKISIEGHTDAQQYANKLGTYGNWELSTDRANVARRVMQGDGIGVDQVSQVRGFADQRLHIPLKPFDAANRRVSLVVQNLPEPDKPAATETAANEAPATPGHEKPSAGTPVEGVKGEKSVKTEKPEAKSEAAPAPDGEGKSATPAAASAEVKPAGMLAKVKGMFHH